MYKHLRTFLAYLLAIAIVVTNIPMSANAEDTAESPEIEYKTENAEASEEPQVISELTEKRDEVTKYFAMSNGTIKACIYPQNVHYLENGIYEEIDNTLVRSSKDGKNYYKNKKNSFSVKIPETLEDEYVEFSDENGYVKFKLLGAENKKIKKAEKAKESKNADATRVKNVNDRAIFKSVKGDVDVVYDLAGNKLKETIVLSKKTKQSFVFEVKTSATKAVVNNDNSISFFDIDGTEIYQMEAPYMSDAAGEYSNAVQTKLEKSKGGYKLTYAPDYKWLSAKERVYPVEIDPTLIQAIYKETVTDTYVGTMQTASNPDIRGGWDVLNIGRRTTTISGSQIVMRTYIKFAIPSEIGANDCIVDAKLDLLHYTGNGDSVNGTQIDVHELTSAFSEGSTWWGNQPSYDPIITDYAIVNTKNYFAGSSFSYDSFNLTRLVNKWHNGGANHGIVLKYHDDTVNVSTNRQVFYFAKQSVYYGSISKFVEITYRNTTGLEDYWSYTTQDFGQYGTGNVNNYNGNLVYVHDDVSFNSGINGFTLTHVYNSCNVNKTYKVNNQMGYYGAGWKLNLVQKLEPVTVTGYSNVKYKYTDGDGTEHYFVETSDGKIVDEDGLGYTYENISEGQITRQITNKNGTILKFDQWDYLRKIIDSNGNTINLNYLPIPYVDNYLASITTSSGGTFSLDYDSNYNLTSITDNAGRKTLFKYNSGNLTEIQYPDGTILKMEYSQGNHRLNNIVSPDGSKICYEYNAAAGKVKKAWTVGTDQAAGNCYQFNYDQNQTRIVDSYNRGITYQFDTAGRATCVYDDEQNIYSQTYNSNVTNGSGVFKNNKLNAASKGTAYVNNLLANAVFANNLSSWRTYAENQNAQISVVSNNGLITSKSIKISSDKKNVNAIMQTPTASSNCTYTFSGYLKTEEVQSASHGAGLEVIIDGGTGTKFYYSDFITGTTDSEIDNGFQKLSVTFTLEKGETINRLTTGLYNASGIVYINSLQLEEGETANQINLVDNSSFERNSGAGSIPSGFVDNFYAGMSGITVSEKRDGNSGYKISGIVGQNHYLNQQINVGGKAGSAYSFGGWAKGSSVSKKDNTNFDIIIHFAYNDGTHDWFENRFNEYVSEWQFVMNTVIAQKDFYAMEIYCCYYHNINVAYFDNLFIYRDTMQSYMYDKNGNVISTSDYADQNQTFQYNEKNDLAKLISPTGSSYEYLYDNKHNLTSARSGESVAYDITYDSQGNVVYTTAGNHRYSTSIQNGKTYYIRLMSTGKYLAVAGWGTANNTNVIQENFTGADNQKWKLEQTSEGYYCLHPLYLPNMSLDLTNGVGSTDGNIAIYANNLSDAQKYRIIPQDDYTYQLESKCFPDRVVTVPNATAQNSVMAYTRVGSNNQDQEWYFEEVEEAQTSLIEDDAIYQFRARNSGKYMDLRGGNTDIGTVVQQYRYNYTESQKYILNRYENTDYYTITTYKDKTKLLEMSPNVNSSGYRYLQVADNIVTDSKLFKFEYNAATQGFYIVPKANEAFALAVMNSGIADSVDLIFTDKQSETNRFFIAERISDTITSSATYQDNGNYPHTVTDSRGNTTTYTYDTKRGLQTGVTNAKGDTTEYTYNSKNDRLENVKTDNSIVKYQYTTVGALKNITSPSGTSYYFNYDVFGRISRISVGSQLLSETIYRDNYLPLVSRFNYGNGTYKTYAYDNQDRLISETINEATSRKYLYDKNGNVAKIEDLLANVTTSFQYDLIGRVVGIKTSDGQSMRFVYDKYNRLSLSKWTLGDTSLGSSYIYGDISVTGQKTGLIYGVNLNGAQQLGYEYDELSRLQKRTVGTETPFITEYTYLEGKESNTTTTLVKTVQNGDDTLEYTYDELGNITTVSKSGIVIEQYSYDALNQLKTAVYGEDVYQYAYDNGGNLTEIKKNNEVIKSYGYGNSEWKDLLTSFNGETITYDEIGNPLVYRNGMSFTWQNGRQLANISQNGAELASYTYNADGLRTSKTVNGVTTEYYWLNGTLQGQKTGDESIFFLYDENGKAYGFLMKNGTGESTYYYELNVQGDVIGIIDSTGTKVVEYTYGAWGDILSVTGTLADTIGQRNPLRYRGYYYDAETGFYYLQSRYYDAEVGRFISADTITDGGAGLLGNNLFIYAANNPVNNSDIMGHWIIKDAIKWVTEKVAKPVVETVKKNLSKVDATYSKGICGNASIGIWGFSAQAGISIDTKGSIGLQGTFIGGATTNNSPTYSIGNYSMVTNAPGIEKLNGFGYQLGGSANILIPAPVAISVGREFNIISDSRRNKNYYGISSFNGIAPPTPSVEVHAEWGKTGSVSYEFNIFDVMQKIYIKIMDW